MIKVSSLEKSARIPGLGFAGGILKSIRLMAHRRNTARILGLLHDMSGRGMSAAELAARQKMGLLMPSNLNFSNKDILKGWSEGKAKFLDQFRTADRKLLSEDFERLSAYQKRLRAAARLAQDPGTRRKLVSEADHLSDVLKARHLLAEVGGAPSGGILSRAGGFLWNNVSMPYAAYGSAMDAYNDLKEGNYGSAAYNAAQAGLTGMIGASSWGKTLGGSKYRLLRSLGGVAHRIGAPITMMEGAGRYGSRGGFLKNTGRWMQRHPWLTLEAAGAPAGVGLVRDVGYELPKSMFESAVDNRIAEILSNDPAMSGNAINARMAQSRVGNESDFKWLPALGLGMAGLAGASYLIGKNRREKARLRREMEDEDDEQETA